MASRGRRTPTKYPVAVGRRGSRPRHEGSRPWRTRDVPRPPRRLLGGRAARRTGRRAFAVRTALDLSGGAAPPVPVLVEAVGVGAGDPHGRLGGGDVGAIQVGGARQARRVARLAAGRRRAWGGGAVRAVVDRGCGGRCADVPLVGGHPVPSLLTLRTSQSELPGADERVQPVLEHVLG